MFRQSATRNQRTKGFKVKHAFQIALLLVVSIWLLYQVKHSNDKKAYVERDVKVSKGHGNWVPGRKEKPGFSERVETDHDEEKIGEKEDEAKPGGDEKNDGGGGVDELDRHAEEKPEEEAHDHEDLKDNSTNHEEKAKEEVLNKEHEDLKENPTRHEENGGEPDQESQNGEQQNNEEGTPREDSGDAQVGDDHKDSENVEQEENVNQNPQEKDVKEIEQEENVNQNPQEKDVKESIGEISEKEENVHQNHQENNVKESTEEISLQSGRTEGSVLDQNDTRTDIHDFQDQNGVPKGHDDLGNLGLNETKINDPATESDQGTISTDKSRNGSPAFDQKKDLDNQTVGDVKAPDGEETVHSSLPNESIDAELPAKSKALEREEVASREEDAASGTTVTGDNKLEGVEFDLFAKINANADGQSSSELDNHFVPSNGNGTAETGTEDGSNLDSSSPVVAEDKKEGSLQTVPQSESQAEA